MKKKQQKEYNYVMVFTDNGPKFVTECHYVGRICKWDGKIPMEFYHDDASYLAMALTVNGNYAIAVCSRFQIETQPYNYEKGQFVWQDAKKEM